MKFQNRLILALLLLFGALSQAAAQGLVLALQHSQNDLGNYYSAVAHSLSEKNVIFERYVVDNEHSIDEHTALIQNVIKQQPTAKIFLLADRGSSFVALHLASVDTSIVALITLSGAFADGADFIYNEASYKKNRAFVDSLSLDGSKERQLRNIYRLINSKKQGQSIALPDDADADTKAVFDLLESKYGSSLVAFSLAEHLEKIRSTIVPCFTNDNVGYAAYTVDIPTFNLCLKDVKNAVKCAPPILNFSPEADMGTRISGIVDLLMKGARIDFEALMQFVR